MRILVFALTFVIIGCVSSSGQNVLQDEPRLHCPAYGASRWSKSLVSKEQAIQLINKQEFAIPKGYQTHWFKSVSGAIGLCIVPNQKNRGSDFGCGSAYAIYTVKSNKWQLKSQRVTICRR